MNGRTPQHLQTLLEKHFDLSELRQLAFVLGIDHENLEGSNKRDFIISLIRYAQRHGLIEELYGRVEKGRPERQNLPESSIFSRMSFGTKVTMISIVVTIVGIIVTLFTFFPGVLPFGDPGTETPVPDKILLQVQVNDAEELTAIANAVVKLDVAGQIFAPERTDSNGRAVFELPAEFATEIAHITVEFSAQVKNQNITVDFGMRSVEFQVRP